MNITTPAGWHGDQRKITKQFAFDSFPAAIAFMVEVSLHCEKADHHPTWTNTYRTVAVELSTHDAGAVTEKDVDLAAAMDAAFARRR